MNLRFDYVRGITSLILLDRDKFLVRKQIFAHIFPFRSQEKLQKK